MMVAKGDRNM